MSPYRRNIIVGITVLAALGFLGWLILKFGEAPARLFANPTIPARFITTSAEGLSEGSPVLYQGVNVGRVRTVERSDNLKEVIISAEVEPPLPENVIGRIKAQSLLGAGSAINLELVGPEPVGQLAPNTTISAENIGSGVLPPEFASLAHELELAAREFRESNVIVHLDEQVLKLGEVLDSIGEVLGDEQVQGDLKASLQNIRVATENASRVSARLDEFTGELQELSAEARGTIGEARVTIAKTGRNIDDLSKQASGRIEQIAVLLDNLNAITAKISTGQGTAGLLVNDAKLYENLVETSEALNTTVQDLSRLVEQWEQEGVSLKLSR